MDEMLTVKEAAGRLKLAEETVRKMCRDGRLPCVKVGRLLRIKAADVAALVGEVA